MSFASCQSQMTTKALWLRSLIKLMATFSKGSRVFYLNCMALVTVVSLSMTPVAGLHKQFYQLLT